MLTYEDRHSLIEALYEYASNKCTEFGEDIEKLGDCLCLYRNGDQDWCDFDRALQKMIKQTMREAIKWEYEYEDTWIVEWREKYQPLLDKLAKA